MTCELQPALTLEALLSVASACRNRIQIASAYAKVEPFRRICNVSSGCDLKLIIVRWQFCDLAAGASDLDLYEVAKNSGWRLYFQQDLHAKVFLFDNLLFTGSYNLTSRGLAGAPPAGNIEYGVKCPSTPEFVHWFDSLVSRSVEVDDELYQAIQSDLENYRKVSGAVIPIRKGFSQEVNTLVTRRQAVPSLFLHDLPHTSSPEILMIKPAESDAARHDVQLFGLPLNPSQDQLRNAFRISPGYTWLLDAVRDGEAYFGAITAKLHNALRDEPKPYRREVKERLACLLAWAAFLLPEKIIIDRPRQSQRIRIIS